MDFILLINQFFDWRTVAQMSASLGLAVFFWSTLIIAQGEMLEKVVTVPAEFTASPANLVLVGDKDKNVRASFLRTLAPSHPAHCARVFRWGPPVSASPRRPPWGCERRYSSNTR
jgi:hypothetical protein